MPRASRFDPPRADPRGALAAIRLQLHDLAVRKGDGAIVLRLVGVVRAFGDEQRRRAEKRREAELLCGVVRVLALPVKVDKQPIRRVPLRKVRRLTSL